MRTALLIAFGLFYSFQASALFGGFFGGGKQAFEIELGGDKFVIEANVAGPEFEGDGDPENPGQFDYWSISLSKVEVTYDGSSYYLKSEFGWGHTPLNQVCAQIGEQLGRPETVYADGYGQLGTLSVFGSPSFLVVGKDDSFSISDSEPNGQTYYAGFTCTSIEFEY